MLRMFKSVFLYPVLILLLFCISMESTTVVDAKSRIIKVTGKLVIKNLVEVMAGFQPGEEIDSDTFMLGDIPLRIHVYPKLGQWLQR